MVKRYTKFLLSLLLLLVFTVITEATTVKVNYDVGFGNRIAIRGSKSPFSWSSGVNATWTTGNVWTYSWPNSVGDVEIKPLVNDSVWSKGSNYLIKSGASVDIYPFFYSTQGNFDTTQYFYSPQFANNRTILVYLPPSYNENRLKRYPVLYMHDGQNIFNASTSFGGVEWRVDETANMLINNGQMDEVIIVGIYNTGANRLYEYTPCCDSSYGGGGADSYQNFLINTLKPYIDGKYRTLTTRENTAIMGSSLGGLVSFYIGRNRPDVFSKVGALSSSFWWNDTAVVKTVETSTAYIPVKFYIDAGTNNDGLANTTRMRDALLADGYVQGKDLYYYVAQGGSHSEASWAARMNIPLTYLFPWGSTSY